MRDDSDSEANKNSSGQNNLGSLGKNDGCTGATNNRATITKQLRQKPIVQSSHNSSANIKKLSIHNSNSMRLNMESFQKHMRSEEYKVTDQSNKLEIAESDVVVEGLEILESENRSSVKPKPTTEAKLEEPLVTPTSSIKKL